MFEQSYYAANYSISIVGFVMILFVRAVAVTWLLAVAGREKYLVFIVVMLLRIAALRTFDTAERIRSRGPLRTILEGLALSVTDLAWKKDEENPADSLKMLNYIVVITTLENTFGILWAAFLTPVSNIHILNTIKVPS